MTTYPHGSPEWIAARLMARGTDPGTIAAYLRRTYRTDPAARRRWDEMVAHDRLAAAMRDTSAGLARLTDGLQRAADQIAPLAA